MNFITDLPENKVYKDIYDAVLNVIDKFLKMCHYISCWKNMIVKDFVKIFIQKIVCLHEISIVIVLNWELLFISQFWINVMYTLKIKQWLSIVFYSQINRQTEHQNNVFEQYLQSYVNYEQNNWTLLLFLTEFVYNANKHFTIQKTFFEMIYKYTSRFNLLTVNKIVQYIAKQESSAETESLMNWLCINCEKTQKFLIRAQKYQKKYYNKKWWNIMFKSEQKVWLYVKNIFIKKLLQKLNWLCYELYRILKQLKNQIYKLKLLKTLNIHNVFHVSLFRAHKLCEDEKSSELKSLCLVKDSNVHKYEISVILNLWVQTILNEQLMLQYQIAWKEYTDFI